MDENRGAAKACPGVAFPGVGVGMRGGVRGGEKGGALARNATQA